MMHGMEKSDEAVLPVKAANKGAESDCGAAGGKGLNQGESGRSKHTPDAVPGKCGTGDGPDTASGRRGTRRSVSLRYTTT